MNTFKITQSKGATVVLIGLASLVGLFAQAPAEKQAEQFRKDQEFWKRQVEKTQKPILDAFPQTPDAVPNPNSNQIFWREGAPGAFTFAKESMTYLCLRYKGKVVQVDLRLWGSNMMAYVEVTNGTDEFLTIDTANEISVQLTLPMRDTLLPLQTAQLARLLVKQSKHNKSMAQTLAPWKLGPEPITAKGKWANIFFFAFREKFDDRFIKHADLQVNVSGVAFIFPFTL